MNAFSGAGPPDALIVVCAVHLVIVGMYLAYVCLAYEGYVAGRMHIEPVIQTLAVFVGAQYIGRSLYIGHRHTVNHQQMGNAADLCALGGIAVFAIFRHQVISVVFFGVIGGLGVGGLVAIADIATATLLRGNRCTLTELELAKMCTEICAVLLFGVPLLVQALAAHTIAWGMVICSMIAFGAVAMSLEHFSWAIDYASGIDPPPRPVASETNQNQETKARRAYALCMSFTSAVLTYYDIAFPCILFYVNHLPSHKKTFLHDLSWVQFDAIGTVFGVTASFLCIRAVAKAVAEMTFGVAPVSANVTVIYVAVFVKLICVIALPTDAFVLEFVCIASIASGCIACRKHLPHFSICVDDVVSKYTAIVLNVLMILGSHIDNETLTLTVTSLICSIAMCLTVVCILLTTTSFAFDTTFVNSLCRPFIRKMTATECFETVSRVAAAEDSTLAGV